MALCVQHIALPHNMAHYTARRLHPQVPLSLNLQGFAVLICFCCMHQDA